MDDAEFKKDLDFCFGTGHSASYWKTAGAVEIEAFANMFSSAIRSAEAYNVIKKFFPESLNLFEQIVRSL